MRAVQIKRLAERLQLKSIQKPEFNISNQEYLVKVKYAPINPSDIYFAKGVYGTKPKLPQILGFECVGQVVESHQSDEIGKFVACFNENGGTWADYVLCKKKYCIHLDDNQNLEQFACSIVNPLTAMGFLYIGKNSFKYQIQYYQLSK